MKTADKIILTNILNLARKVLQPYPPLELEQKRAIIKKSSVIKNQLQHITPLRKSKILSFISFITGEHPIFESPRFLLPNIYNPLIPDSYHAFHQIQDSKKSDTHGNNYLYTKTNLRNGILFTYHDKETNAYIPVTFNTNFPICLVAPDPFCIEGDPVEVIGRMLTYFHKLSKRANLKNFPLIFKGLDEKTVDQLSEKYNYNIIKIDNDPDITTITAEMNCPAISYNINDLKNIVYTKTYDKSKNKKKPKLIKVTKKLDALTYCEEWKFDKLQTQSIARKWAFSKIDRLKHHGMAEVDRKYMINTVIKVLSELPPGEQNKDYFTIAIKSKISQGKMQKDQLLGVVIASRNNKTVAALNAVVIPVNKQFRDIGYYTVYKLAEKMSNYGILTYWHGPKELINDVNAVIEFMGEPDKREKKYCIKCRTIKQTQVKHQGQQEPYSLTWNQATF